MLLLERYRGLGRSQRPGAVLHGCTPDIIASVRSTGAKVLLVSGSFYAGKRRVTDLLVKSGRFTELLGSKTRRARSRERLGLEPYCNTSFRSLYSDDPALVICNVPMFAENRAWTRCGKRFGIKVPDEVELGQVMSEFFSIYRFSEIEEVSRMAARSGQVVVIETTPNQEEDWLKIFPDLQILHLEVAPEEILRRSRLRKGFRGPHNPLIKRIKVLEALCMPEISSARVPIRRVRHNKPIDTMFAVETAFAMFSNNPRTWFWLPCKWWRERKHKRSLANTRLSQEVLPVGAVV